MILKKFNFQLNLIMGMLVQWINKNIVPNNSTLRCPVEIKKRI